MYDNPILYTDGTAKEEDLDRIEQKFHIKIPKEMREHYLAYNGGCPERTVFTDKNGDEYFVDLFIPVRERFKRPIEKTLELLRADGGVISDWLIPFAEEIEGNFFCFSVRESDFGAIYYYDHELSRCFSSGDTSKSEEFASSLRQQTGMNTARTRRSI